MTTTKPVPVDPVARAGDADATGQWAQPPATTPGGSVEVTLTMLDDALRPLATEGRSQELAMSFGAFLTGSRK